MNNGTTSVKAKMGRVIMGRILPGTELVKGILNICKENDLKFGNIVTMIGSLSKARFVCATPDNRAKIGIKYGNPIEIEGPLEFLCGQGIIGISDNKERAIHLHYVLSDKNVNLYGGHLVEDGNLVLTTIEIVIQELKDVKLLRALDIETGFPLFKAYNKKD